ncbi:MULTISPECIES: RNA chaperone Hfq [unclassified Caballeronia]|nr:MULTISPECIES: RNA chaperone Hfq [unclassified Caballeronia]MCE4541842.1 RNA chaperone Hfq [Caballeronia sp. PC1]MCE4569114.1 RNA chaperone Hfq [Caballeronia sp. CLC5]
MIIVELIARLEQYPEMGCRADFYSVIGHDRICLSPSKLKDKTEMAQNQPGVQGDFLNAARKEGKRVAIYLVNGIRLVGHIQSFDTYMLYLSSTTGSQMIFKHSISTIGEDTGPAVRSNSRASGPRDFTNRSHAK